MWDCKRQGQKKKKKKKKKKKDATSWWMKDADFIYVFNFIYIKVQLSVYHHVYSFMLFSL